MTQLSSGEPTPVETLSVETLPEDTTPSLARSSSIIAVGNIASRVLGLVRETTITYFFGATGLVTRFRLPAPFLL